MGQHYDEHTVAAIVVAQHGDVLKVHEGKMHACSQCLKKSVFALHHMLFQQRDGDKTLDGGISP